MLQCYRGTHGWKWVPLRVFRNSLSRGLRTRGTRQTFSAANIPRSLILWAQQECFRFDKQCVALLHSVHNLMDIGRLIHSLLRLRLLLPQQISGAKFWRILSFCRKGHSNAFIADSEDANMCLRAHSSQATLLPSQLTVLGITFRLAGVTVQTGGHFAAAIPFERRWLHYDGMKSPPLRVASPPDGLLNHAVYVPI
ncbi:hypothetical protein QR680_017267 [Steinernema hermaphroditum]|uniref:Uncharacterized protein n=1 Tax=Steinernema hermaphroditum TaxID=289476 RepID=A0AA39HF48_9BILA|nr:hypothetical protein QR680_017267 [Steinernema hermaphroditum]